MKIIISLYLSLSGLSVNPISITGLHPVLDYFALTGLDTNNSYLNLTAMPGTGDTILNELMSSVPGSRFKQLMFSIIMSPLLVFSNTSYLTPHT